MKAYGFTMKRDNVTIETFVYSEHGKDICLLYTSDAADD